MGIVSVDTLAACAGGGTGREDNVHWQADQFGRQHGQLIRSSVRIPLLDLNCPTIDAAELA
jgi:hypothetical protein